MADVEVDVLILGGGPSGLVCAIEAKRAGLSHLIVDKGSMTNGIRRFPRNLIFFSTPELLSIGEIPFPCTALRPNRLEVLCYYRKVIEHFQLKQRLYTEVTSASRLPDGRFMLASASGEQFIGRSLVLATGYFDQVNRLNIPGEDLPHVHRYYDEAAVYSGCRVVILGGGNTAAETALDLYRNGVSVTLVHRQAEVKGSVKYWLKPDLENRISEGSIQAYFETEAVEIKPHSVRLRSTNAAVPEEIPADFVLPLIGYRPQATFLEQLGAEFDRSTLVPKLDPDTFETSIPQLFLVGSATTGAETGKIFIENSRHHGKAVLAGIKQVR